MIIIHYFLSHFSIFSPEILLNFLGSSPFVLRPSMPLRFHVSFASSLSSFFLSPSSPFSRAVSVSDIVSYSFNSFFLFSTVFLHSLTFTVFIRGLSLPPTLLIFLT